MIPSSYWYGTTTTIATKHLWRSVIIRLIDDVRFLAAIATFRLEFPSWHGREKEKKKRGRGFDGAVDQTEIG